MRQVLQVWTEMARPRSTKICRSCSNSGTSVLRRLKQNLKKIFPFWSKLAWFSCDCHHFDVKINRYALLTPLTEKTRWTVISQLRCTRITRSWKIGLSSMAPSWRKKPKNRNSWFSSTFQSKFKFFFTRNWNNFVLGFSLPTPLCPPISTLSRCWRQNRQTRSKIQTFCSKIDLKVFFSRNNLQNN